MFAFISFECYTEFDSPFKLLGKYIPLFEGEFKGEAIVNKQRTSPCPLAEGDKYSCLLKERGQIILTSEGSIYI
jgi:hypothetical protein